jgi:predicted kinase
VTARTGDASDADAAVVAQQFTYETGSLDWQRIDASGDAQTILDAAKRLIQP